MLLISHRRLHILDKFTCCCWICRQIFFSLLRSTDFSQHGVSRVNQRRGSSQYRTRSCSVDDTCQLHKPKSKRLLNFALLRMRIYELQLKFNLIIHQVLRLLDEFGQCEKKFLAQRISCALARPERTKLSSDWICTVKAGLHQDQSDELGRKVINTCFYSSALFHININILHFIIPMHKWALQ